MYNGASQLYKIGLKLFKTHLGNVIKMWFFNILYAYVFMHNMIIKDGENVGLEVCFDVVDIPNRCEFTIDYYTQGNRKIKKMKIFITCYTMVSLNIYELW